MACALLAACTADRAPSVEEFRDRIRDVCEARHGTGDDAAAVCPVVTFCAMEHPKGVQLTLVERELTLETEIRELSAYRDCLRVESERSSPYGQSADDPAST